MEKLNLAKVITIQPEASIFDALFQMQTNFVKHIVITIKRKPMGIVTERDINRFLGEDKTARAIDEIPIKHVMEKNVITLPDNIEDIFYQCAARMETFKIGSVVIVNDEGDLVGIVSRTDLTQSYADVFGGKYTVKNFMNKKTITCRKDDSIKYAINLMNSNKISKLVVTNENGYPIGIISTNTLLIHSDFFTKGNTRSRDYLIPIKKGEKLMVHDLMTDDLLTINEEEDLAVAANKMIKNKISGLPVIDSNKNLVGIITKTDVIRAFSLVRLHEQLGSKYKELY